ncbi:MULTISPECIES: hypothetical protein [unclassified Saccharothrix]|uniref:hypothetical protein n=1 Tax=unclassified Saccharothrix TaxID=2593673 RepID=UPI00307EDDB6
MTWDYYPDGKLKSRSDHGVPVGAEVALVDNSDTGNVELAGNWATTSGGAQGYDYRSEEKLASVVKATTRYTYNEIGAPVTREHDRQSSVFAYTARDLVESVTNTETGGQAKVTRYSYTDRGQVRQETKPNGNKVLYDYHLDGARRPDRAQGRYAFTGGNPISRIEIDGHDWFDDYMNVIDTTQPAADPNAPPLPLPRAGVPYTPSAPTPAPSVENDKLKRIVDTIYAKPTAQEVHGRGTTADALRYELDWGLKVGARKERSHVLEAATQFGSLAQWLDDVRAGKITASEADVSVARAEAADLWDALTTPDQTGMVVDEIKEDERKDKHFRNNLEKGISKAAVADITGAHFGARPYTGQPYLTKYPQFAAGFGNALGVVGFGVAAYNRGWEQAFIESVDVTGVGGQYLEQQACIQYDPMCGEA